MKKTILMITGICLLIWVCSGPNTPILMVGDLLLEYLQVQDYGLLIVFNCKMVQQFTIHLHKR